MAYCVKCGVELNKGLKACPLCDTEVILPETFEDEETSAFSDRVPRRSRSARNVAPSKSFVFLATFIMLVPLLVTLIIDFSTNRSITWSFYPVTSLLLLWVLLSYPSFFRKYTLFQVFTVDVFAVSIFLLALDMYSGEFPEWAHFASLSLLLIWVYVAGIQMYTKSKKLFLGVLICFIGSAAFLWAMDYFTYTSKWFLPLALPLLALVSAASILAGLIVYKVINKKIRKLFALGMSSLILTIFLFAVNLIIDLYLYGKLVLSWSPILASFLIPATLFFLIVNKAPELKAYLIKKFHL